MSLLLSASPLILTELTLYRRGGGGGGLLRPAPTLKHGNFQTTPTTEVTSFWVDWISTEMPHKRNAVVSYIVPISCQVVITYNFHIFCHAVISSFISNTIVHFCIFIIPTSGFCSVVLKMDEVPSETG